MCTSLKMKPASDGSVVVGRSMEFPDIVPYAVAALPVGYEGAATPNGSAPGKKWTGTYGVVGICAFGTQGWLTDGINTAGVSAHLLYMSDGFCTYPAFKGDGSDIAQVDLIAYLLTTCSSVDEVKQALQDITIWGADPGLGSALASHFFVHDPASSIAVEFLPDGTLSVVDNPTGVGTNAPYLDWHLLNLRNYIGFDAFSPDAGPIDGITVAPFGQGQGLNVLPGGYTPPARFVRAAVLVELASQPETGAEAEQTVGHLLNTFDIVRGTVLEHMGGKTVSEETTYDAIFNLTSRRFAYRTVSDPTWYAIDLSAVDFTKPARMQAMSFSGGFTSISL